MADDVILAATCWPSNAELIRDVARLGYLREEWHTLDPTSGRQIWWKLWRPRLLVTHDIAIDGVDWRKLPEDNNTFDAIAWDPTYVSAGGRKTTTIPEFHQRFGMTDAPATPALLQKMINDGFPEMRRVLKRKGILLVKCQDYISSGKLWNGTLKTQLAAMAEGFVLIDKFEHISKTSRPQPERTRADGKESVQVHARRNMSTLLVLQKVR